MTRIYDLEYPVTLTVAEWLELQCALSDARNANEEQGCPALARGIVRLKARINSQCGHMIDAATDECSRAIAAASEAA